MTSTSAYPPGPASIALPGGTTTIPQSAKSRPRLSKNPFRRHENPSMTPTSAPPPAYSSLADDHRSTLTSKKATSLFSWKSGGSKLSWVWKGKTFRGEKSLAKEAVHPELPSSADKLKSTWKRRQNRHGTLEFEMQPPFVVELDRSLPPQTRKHIQLGSLAVASHPQARSTYTPSPGPAVIPKEAFVGSLPLPVPPALSPSPAIAKLVPRAPTTTPPNSRLPRIVETSQLGQAPLPSPAISSEPSPDLAKHIFSDKFPLPPARRPSSARLVGSQPSPTPHLTHTTTSGSLPSKPPYRFISSSLPRPKNGPYTARNPYPLTNAPSATKATRSLSPPITSPTSISISPRSTSQQSPSLRNLVLVPSKPSDPPSARSTRTNSVALKAVTSPTVQDEASRSSWDSSTTFARSSSASGASIDTIVASPGSVSPLSDLRKRTIITAGGIAPSADSRETASTRSVTTRQSYDHEPRRSENEGAFDEKERLEWEKQVEEMFSETRMKDLLIQLGI